MPTAAVKQALRNNSRSTNGNSHASSADSRQLVIIGPGLDHDFTLLMVSLLSTLLSTQPRLHLAQSHQTPKHIMMEYDETPSLRACL